MIFEEKNIWYSCDFCWFFLRRFPWFQGRGQTNPDPKHCVKPKSVLPWSRLPRQVWWPCLTGHPVVWWPRYSPSPEIKWEITLYCLFISYFVTVFLTNETVSKPLSKIKIPGFKSPPHCKLRWIRNNNFFLPNNVFFSGIEI